MRLACYSSKDLSDETLKAVASVIFQAACAFRDAKESDAEDSELGGPVGGVAYNMRDQTHSPTDHFVEEMASVALVVLSAASYSPVEELANATEPMVKVRPPELEPLGTTLSLCPRWHHTADM